MDIHAAPDPLHIFAAFQAYQRSFALKTAVELDLFTAIGAGAGRVSDLAAQTNASPRGIRVLCDFLTVAGLLTKSNDTYALTPDAATFLDARSPTCIGSAASFLVHVDNVMQFARLTESVRTGGAADGGRNLDPDAPIWVEFARAMAPLATMIARIVAPLVNLPDRPMRVLDIAAGHGAYGLEIARLNPQATIYAQDWQNVLTVAREQAERAGVLDRFHTIPGDAFTVDLGSNYDLVLLPNFLHHFDHRANVKLLRRVRDALAPGGRVATVEFVPDESRVAPPAAAGFALTMLASTGAGDAYTFRELEAMFREAGFGASQAYPAGPQTVILTDRG